MTDRQPRHARRRAISRRDALVSITAACAALQFSPSALAQAWPTKTLRIIVPFAPGGPADGSARVLAEAMAPALGQSIIVENKTGAGGAIGVTAAAQSNDGHTLLMGSTSMVVTPHLVPNLQYNVTRDFEPIGMVSAQPLVLVVPASSPLGSVKDVIAAAKAKPGKLTAGNSGNGTLAHLTAELFSKQTDVSLTSVPYRGESALMPDLPVIKDNAKTAAYLKSEGERWGQVVRSRGIKAE